MIHLNEIMENKIVLQVTSEEVKNYIDKDVFYRYKIDFELKPKDLLLFSNQDRYYYDYVIPHKIDKADYFEFENIDYAELFINNLYSCPIDNEVEIVPCASCFEFTIRIYFSIFQSLPETIKIKYNAYLFPTRIKVQISQFPFQTDNHMYIDSVVETL